VAAGLDAASLRPLPDVRESALLVSGVEEATVEGASRVVAALQPPNGYGVWLGFCWRCGRRRWVGFVARRENERERGRDSV